MATANALADRARKVLPQGYCALLGSMASVFCAVGSMVIPALFSLFLLGWAILCLIGLSLGLRVFLQGKAEMAEPCAIEFDADTKRRIRAGQVCGVLAFLLGAMSFLGTVIFYVWFIAARSGVH